MVVFQICCWRIERLFPARRFALVDTVLVARRTDKDVAMKAGRDHWLDEECRRQRSTWKRL